MPSKAIKSTEKNTELFRIINDLPEEEREVVGLIGQYMCFAEYLKRSNMFDGDFYDFIREFDKVTPAKIKKELESRASTWFAFTMVKGKLVYGMCHRFGVEFVNANWINTMNFLPEAYDVFLAISDYKFIEGRLEWPEAIYFCCIERWPEKFDQQIDEELFEEG